MTPRKRNDFVAKKLKIECKGCDLIEIVTSSGPPFWKRHPPFHSPDLLAPAGFKLLMEALWQRPCAVEITREYATLFVVGNRPISAKIIDGNLARALLQATYEMLKKGGGVKNAAR